MKRELEREGALWEKEGEKEKGHCEIKVEREGKVMRGAHLRNNGEERKPVKGSPFNGILLTIDV